MFKAMANMTERVEKLQEEIKQMIKTEGEKAMKEMFSEMFEKFPLVEEVSWCQGTPGFNDGDPCVFRMYETEFKIKGHDEHFDGDWSFKYRFKTDEGGKLPQDLEGYPEMVQEVKGLVMGNEDMMKTLFGDGAKIMVSKEKVQVEDYYME